MLLQLENTNKDNILKLIEFAKQLNLKLSLIDDNSTDTWIPGAPLNALQLKNMIESSRKSGLISMKDAHELIRSKFNAD